MKGLLKAFPLSYIEGIKILFNIPKSLRYLILGSNIFALAFSMFGSYIIIYATSDLGLSKIEWSIILTAEAVLTTLMIIPIGKMMDVYGGKKIILLFNIFVIIALIAIMYGNFYLLLIVMPLLGIASSSSSAAFQKLTADFTKRNIRGKTVGVMRFISLIVSAVGSLLGGYIYENTAHITIFLLSMMISLVGVILFFFLVREPEVEEI